MIGYGLVSSLQVPQFCRAVVDVLGGGDAAYRLMCETAAAETLCGTLRDKTPNGAGRGLFQCDLIGFNDVQLRARQSDVDALQRAFDFDLRQLEWSALNHSPLLAAAVCRLHYKLRPGVIPASLEERAAYWKQHYNSVLGKGTVKDYINKVQAWERYF